MFLKIIYVYIYILKPSSKITLSMGKKNSIKVLAEAFEFITDTAEDFVL